ncbi:uncharacterized protein LOC126781453 [Nymphalis io]|uniref:uncharacterized protein LOC126781453 n=1 Tax=Inachis io TaxID=171585 RepID=UPI002168E7CE|nr:uncharacterized protein LOC126781453 [Nymphalis io]
MDVTVIVFCISFNFLLLKSSSDLPQEIVFSPSELQSSNVVSNSSFKPALRYGFHRTSECKDFEKAYICVQKCVDLRYDIAYSDKYCFCTCYHKKEKAKYTPKSFFDQTYWKLGPPSTTKPAWAVSIKTLKVTGIPESEQEEDVTKNVEDISNTTNIYDDTNVLNETSTVSSDTNQTIDDSIDKGSTTDSINSTDSEISNSTSDSNSGGESSTGVTLSPTDAGGASETTS